MKKYRRPYSKRFFAQQTLSCTVERLIPYIRVYSIRNNTVENKRIRYIVGKNANWMEKYILAWISMQSRTAYCDSAQTRKILVKMVAAIFPDRFPSLSLSFSLSIVRTQRETFVEGALDPDEYSTSLKINGGKRFTCTRHENSARPGFRATIINPLRARFGTIDRWKGDFFPAPLKTISDGIDFPSRF